MKRRRLVWLVFLVVLALGLLIPATAYSGYVSRFSGDNAVAAFESSSPDYLKSVYVSAADGQQRLPGSKKVLSSWADVYIFIYDKNSGDMVMEAYGSKALAPADFVMANRLSAATLRGTIPVYDYVNDQKKNAVLKIDWKGTGPLQKGSYSYHYKSPTGIVNYKGTGTDREATATADIRVNGSPVFAGPSTWARLSSNKDFEVVVSKWVYLK